MTSIGIAARRGWDGTTRWAGALGPLRMALIAGLAALAASSPETGGIILKSLSDAFLQVSVFVAATLAIFYGLEVWFRIDAAALMARHRAWQVPVAAALGALPGCGGAIMVITQYMRGGISFGSVVAVLTATMGDAAFLMLAQQPLTGLAIFAIGFVVGVMSGYIVDAMHGPDFMRYRDDGQMEDCSPCLRRVESRSWRAIWFALVLPGLFLGGCIAFQVNTKALFGTLYGIENVVWLGTAGAVVSLLLWGYVSPSRIPQAEIGSPAPPMGWASTGSGRLGDAPARVVGDTCFVTVWVVFAYLIYELGVFYTGVDLAEFFQIWAPLVPLMAIVVGFIPGCGPQLVVATMYLNGLLPFSAEIGNAISNDGDALFPAIAMAPKAAVIATLYSAIPAVLVSYGYYYLFE
ncbi:MAG: putative manganese transporter [Alphaproteobacteria bacterium]